MSTSQGEAASADEHAAPPEAWDAIARATTATWLPRRSTWRTRRSASSSSSRASGSSTSRRGRAG